MSLNLILIAFYRLDHLLLLILKKQTAATTICVCTTFCIFILACRITMRVKSALVLHVHWEVAEFGLLVPRHRIIIQVYRLHLIIGKRLHLQGVVLLPREEFVVVFAVLYGRALRLI